MCSYNCTNDCTNGTNVRSNNQPNLSCTDVVPDHFTDAVAHVVTVRVSIHLADRVTKRTANLVSNHVSDSVTHTITFHATISVANRITDSDTHHLLANLVTHLDANHVTDNQPNCVAIR